MTLFVCLSRFPGLSSYAGTLHRFCMHFKPNLTCHVNCFPTAISLSTNQDVASLRFSIFENLHNGETDICVDSDHSRPASPVRYESYNMICYFSHYKNVPISIPYVILFINVFIATKLPKNWQTDE